MSWWVRLRHTEQTHRHSRFIRNFSSDISCNKITDWKEVVDGPWQCGSKRLPPKRICRHALSRYRRLASADEDFNSGQAAMQSYKPENYKTRFAYRFVVRKPKKKKLPYIIFICVMCACVWCRASSSECLFYLTYFSIDLLAVVLCRFFLLLLPLCKVCISI